MNVYLPKDRVTNQHQGYGFVEFKSEEDADYVGLFPPLHPGSLIVSRARLAPGAFLSEAALAAVFVSCCIHLCALLVIPTRGGSRMSFIMLQPCMLLSVQSWESVCQYLCVEKERAVLYRQ